LCLSLILLTVIIIIHSDKSAGGTRQAATRLAQLAMVLAISMTSSIPAPFTEEPPSLSTSIVASAGETDRDLAGMQL
jgi:hypothetical protein